MLCNLAASAVFTSVLILAPLLSLAQDRQFVIERVSLSTNGIEPNSFSSFPSVSADGRYVAFESNASNLVADDTNGRLDIFLHDRLTGITDRISVATDGAQGSDSSYSVKISADGKFLCFTSAATNLVSADTNAVPDVFVVDRLSRAVERVSLADNDLQFARASGHCSISSDGRFVAFTTHSPNQESQDIHVRDRQVGSTEQINLSTGGEIANGYSSNPSISANGRFVAFDSLATNLVIGDTNGVYDVFVRDRIDVNTERISVASDGSQANGYSSLGAFSADGRHVVFHSYASNLVAGDQNGWQDVFLFDRQTGVAEMVSVSSAGMQSNYVSNVASISADGLLIAFDSRSNNLVPPQMPLAAVYLRERATSATRLISTTNEGSLANNESFGSMISAAGNHIVFLSRASNLVPDDTNDTDDIFIYASLEEGDVNGDHSVTAYDSALTARYAVGLIPFLSEQALAADLSKSGGVTAYDAALIARRAVGMG